MLQRVISGFNLPLEMDTKHSKKGLDGYSFHSQSPRANTASSTKQTEFLRLTPRALDESLHQARLYWHSLAHTAVAKYEGGIAPQALGVRELLKHVPSVP